MVSALVFPDRFVRGWPKADDDRCIRGTAGEILRYRYSTDGHLVAYDADVPRRHTIALYQDAANAAKIAAANVRMVLAIFDVDAPGHVVTDDWTKAESEKLPRLIDAHPGGFVSVTRGGYRLVYALPEPQPIRSQPDDDAWKARYLSWLRYLAERFDVRADEACSDWTRFYRCPHATREGEAAPLDLGTFGDPDALGVWAPVLATKRAASAARTDETHAGAVEPVPIADPANAYGQARLAAAVRYLESAPLSIEGQRGRDTFFSVAAYLMRRLRLPLEVAIDAVDVVYNSRLLGAGTTVWGRDELTNRLASARDTASKVPPGSVMTEAAWAEVQALRNPG